MVHQFDACLPTGWHRTSDYFFSPGIACPAGYSTACHDTRGAKATKTITCCPVVGDATLSCVNRTSMTGWKSTLHCTWVPTAPTSLPVTLTTGGITSTRNLSFGGPSGLNLNAYGVRMIQEKSDITTPINTVPTTIDAPDPTNPTSPGHSPKPSPSSSGLSTGAKAAIGVVIPLVVLGILAISFLWWRRRRYRNEVVAIANSPIVEIKKSPLHTGDVTYELGTPQPELEGDPIPPAELPTGR